MCNNDKYGGIKPSTIPLVSDHPLLFPLAGRFKQWEMNTVAYLIVLLLREQDLWRPFSLKEILNVAEKVTPKTTEEDILVGFRELTYYGWLSCTKPMTWDTTLEFVEKCMNL